LTEEFNGDRKRPMPNHEDVLAALGTLLTEYPTSIRCWIAPMAG